MALNILELLKSQFNDDIVGQLGNFVGEDPSRTKAALGSIFPALLGGLVSKGSTQQGAGDILSMISRGGFGADTLRGLASAYSGGEATKNLQATGSGLLDGIFGGSVGKVIDWVCNSSGIGRSSATSLMGLVIPALLGLLGKEVQGSNLNASGLMNLLASQGGFLKNQAPAGLAGALGLSDLSGLAKTVTAPGQATSFWKWLIPLLVVAVVLLFLFRSCSAPPPVEKAVETIPEKVVTETKKVIGALGQFLAVKLPNGVELNVPEFGVEKKLIAFIEDTGKPVDDTTWFSFDRLEFETGSATLKPTSTEQLNNIAEIMKAYPQVSLKIGGYTDNTGSPEGNLALSQQRAQNTMQELVKSGIDGTRLSAEGYGQEHPVADNATEEGRQQNRRIDIKVTAK